MKNTLLFTAIPVYCAKIKFTVAVQHKKKKTTEGELHESKIYITRDI